MMSKIKFLTLSLLCVVVSGIAQLNTQDSPLKTTSAGKTRALAKNAMKIGDAYSALYYYEQFHQMKPKDMETVQRLADLYELTRDYAPASQAYGKLYRFDPFKYQKDLYRKALMQKMLGQYDSAKINLVEYKRVAGKSMTKALKKQIPIDIKGCDSAMFYLDFPKNVKVSNMGSSVNNPHVEFGPIPLGDHQILFGSLTSDTVHFYDATYDAQVETPMRKFYTASKQGENWVRDEPLDDFNDSEMNMGKIVYSPKTSTYYYTKCKKTARGVSICAIYTRQLKKGTLQEVKKLPGLINMPLYTTTQPAIYYDESRKREVLYFASNRPGGKGGLDIYYTYYDKRKKTWKKPKNLGGRVNTPGTDCTPFYNASERALYFSSDGHPSMGGLDVFKSVKDSEGRTMHPINLGSPINTPQDDLDFSLNPDAQKGYVVSNRPGGTPYMHETCCDDIFEFEVLPVVPFLTDLNLLVASDSDTLANDLVIMKAYDERTKKLTVDTLKTQTGIELLALKRNHQYDFTVIKEGYLSDTFSLKTRGIKDNQHLVQRVNLVPIEPKVSQKMVPVVDTQTVVVMVEKQKVNAADLNLSLQNQQKVEEVALLEEKKIKPLVVPVVEKEKTEPIAAVEEKRIPVEEGKVIPKVEDVVEEKTETPVVLEKKLEPIQEVVRIKKPTELNLLYAFDKYVLTSSDQKEVDQKLISYMKQNPNVKAIISSHTDSRGSDVYNQYLSDQRAQNVVKYMSENGISKDRIQSKGYGESKLKVKDTTKEGKFILSNCQLNRRTEVLIMD